MILKNITFIVPVKNEQDFVLQLHHKLPVMSEWAQNIQIFRLLEQVEPESSNIALQLTFENKIRQEAFDQVVFEQLISDLQQMLSFRLLFFDSHLEKLY